MTKTNTFEPVFFVNPAVLYISHKANLKQHLAWLYLLYHAQEELHKKKSFIISLQELKEGISYKSEKNNQALIELLKAVTKIRVQFDMFNPSTDWPYQALLKRCQVPRYTGGCRYSFHPDLHEYLKLTEDLKPIRLNILSSFKSKYSLAIYCLLISRMAPNITYIELSLNLPEIINLLGYNKAEFLLPGDIKRKIMTQVQQDLDELSDLTVHIDVIHEKRRKIQGFKFIAQLKPSQHEIYQRFYLNDELEEEEAIVEVKEEENQLDKLTIEPSQSPVEDIKEATKLKKSSSKSKKEPKKEDVIITQVMGDNPIEIVPKKKEVSQIMTMDLNKIKNTKVRDEAIKLYHQRLNSYFKTDLKQLLQNYLEDNFEPYRETFFRLLESNINTVMLRNIINRNMGRKTPSLMSASQTVADCIMDKYELFNFRPPEFETWKATFESLEGLESINQFKEDALKTAEHIHRM